MFFISYEINDSLQGLFLKEYVIQFMKEFLKEFLTLILEKKILKEKEFFIFIS